MKKHARSASAETGAPISSLSGTVAPGEHSSLTNPDGLTWPQPGSSGWPSTAPLTLPPLGRKLGETTYFSIYLNSQRVTDTAEHLFRRADAVADYVAPRLAWEIEEKVPLSIQARRSEGCPVRGITLALPDGPERIFIYATEDGPEEELLGLLAHEIGHMAVRLSERINAPADLGLDEGLATWAAGIYWTRFQGGESFHSLVKRYTEEGRLLPLSDIYEAGVPDARHDLRRAFDDPGQCLERRDILYTEWASFLEFLIHNYGWDTLSALLASSRLEISGGELLTSEPNYKGVLGRELEQLEASWRAYIRRLDYNP